MKIINNIISLAHNFQSKTFTSKIVILFVGFIFLLFTLFVFSVGFSPAKSIRDIKAETSTDSVFLSQFGKAWENDEVMALIKEKAYKKALLDLATKDSIQLIINLKDSLVSLTLHGVRIYSIPAKILKSDLFFKTFNSLEYYKYFSEPLAIEHQYSTIVKEPVVVRHAPKDTIEASLNAYKPDTLIQNPAFLQLKLKHDINLVIEQDYSIGNQSNWIRRQFYFRIWYFRTIERFKNFIRLKPQKYYPSIRISLPVDDLRAIYRALPDNSYVVLYYPN